MDIMQRIKENREKEKLRRMSLRLKNKGHGHYDGETLDLVSLLPLEISRHVFSFLDVRNLGKCMEISLPWRNIANDNILWKHHCLKYRLSDIVTEDSIGNAVNLCHWASVWNSFSQTPSYKWYINEYRTIELPKVYSCCACYGSRFVGYCSKFNNLDVYKIVKNKHRARLLASLALQFPNKIPNVALGMDDNFIVVSKHNILLSFEKRGNTYEFYKAFAVIFNGVLNARRDIPEFVARHLTSGPTLEIDAMSDNILWLSSHYIDEVQVLNLRTNKAIPVLSYDNVYVENNMLATWTLDVVRVYNIDGINEAFINNVEDLEDVTLNSSLVATIRGLAAGMQNCIEVWDLGTGEIVLTMIMPMYTWIKLHPKEEIIYTLEASLSENIYRITAWCVRSGDLLWTFKRANHIAISFWKVYFVCEKYLLIFPSAEDECIFYLIDYKDGTCLNEGTCPSKVLPLVPLHTFDYIFDEVWYTLDEYKSITHIRSFLS